MNQTTTACFNNNRFGVIMNDGGGSLRFSFDPTPEDAQKSLNEIFQTELRQGGAPEWANAEFSKFTAHGGYITYSIERFTY